MIREVRQDGFTVRLDLSNQVLAVDAPIDKEREPKRAEPDLAPVPVLFDGFVSASVLSQKAKLFDDVLYAAVELAAQEGKGAFPSKVRFLRDWAKAALSAAEHGEATRVLLAACSLGGTAVPTVPSRLAKDVRQLTESFLHDERRSTPVGFYTDRSDLIAIFRQDRMLMTELQDAAAADSLASLLRMDRKLEAAYDQVLALGARMTNPPRADAGSLLQSSEATPRKILPPSRSHEADLVVKLYGDRPVPEGFDLAEEVIRRIESGSLSLAPRADSGWYDYQSWALESLISLDGTREHDHLRVSDRYRSHLRELFKGLLALSRETQVKQLESPLAAAAPEPPRIYVRPGLTVEPLATYYLRRATSYSFVREVIRQAFGPDWGGLTLVEPRLGATRFDRALDTIVSLFHGAHVRVCRELGLEPDKAMADRDADADDESFQRWAASLTEDPDLTEDNRMMVPVFYDVLRGQMKAWAMLGWSDRPISIDFARPPDVCTEEQTESPTRLNELRRRLWSNASKPEVCFIGSSHRVAFPVTAELYVDRLLDRDAFRHLCDKLRKQSGIIAALQQ